MTTTLAGDIAYTQLSMKTTRAVLGQSLFLTMALIIPLVTHKLGLNYLAAQPMHWMILFAGLTYGPFSGALLGILVPTASFFVSGMPMAAALPLMIPELIVYGFVSGILKKRLTSFGAIAAGLLAGKVVYMGIALLLGRVNVPAFEFIRGTWGPGIIAMVLQIVLLPLLSGLYINATKD
ncbi:hypothetical protein K7I13_03800 [Brucepastera parasyntrophica]|uniref:ECF transporter S component n=1 Tax=Brucepastera parasyntrophica TaxID=2880008 RepID=UPI00210B215D|nr:ECF transporter S component [Brucepastera parasyntrophica]ULQ60443.1 hypothetical protein K7I13_03800 [Brucepastera parasyntrophica]